MQLCAHYSKSIHLVALMALAVCAPAQTVKVDMTASHVANTFSPLRALGTTLDRIPSNTTDIFFARTRLSRFSRLAGDRSPTARTRSCLFRPGIGIQKENGVIPAEMVISSETRRRQKR
jgi:hypothetical protein